MSRRPDERQQVEDLIELASAVRDVQCSRSSAQTTMTGDQAHRLISVMADLTKQANGRARVSNAQSYSLHKHRRSRGLVT